MVGRAIKTVTVDAGSLIDAIMFTSTMAIRCLNKNAANVEAGGVRRWRWCEVQNGGSSMLVSVSGRIMLCADRSS